MPIETEQRTAEDLLINPNGREHDCWQNRNLSCRRLRCGEAELRSQVPDTGTRIIEAVV
jgi:hypothetical protein